jgi:hypothetical protein
MKDFIVWYSQEESGKIYFSAESMAEAKALIEKVKEGELEVEDLPNYDRKIKWFDFTLEEVEG